MQAPYHPNARGFDDFYGFASGHWGNYFSPPLEHNGKLVKGRGFLVDDLVGRGLDFIETNKGQPFFLYLPLNTPHSPMQVPEEYWSRFENRELKMRYRDSTLEKLNFTRAALAMVENIDYNVGRISDKLNELDLRNNTILIYLSDNGPNGWRWNGGMRGRKGSTDEGGVRTPFFLQWPDSILAGKKISSIASAIDVMPTLADLVDVPLRATKPLDGKSLTPLILEEDPKWEERLVFNHWQGKTSVRSQNYRLDNEDRLYDMVNDLSQEVDISAQQPEIFKYLMQAKETWLDTMTPPTLEKEERPFPVGHPDFTFTQLPARDGMAHGNIKRSNRYPNCSFFTNWKNTKDKISWEVEVLEEGDYEVTIYYTCKPQNVGATIELEFNNERLLKEVTEANDPPLTGMENDRDPRIESYVKDFKPLEMGVLNLKKGRGELKLSAIEIPGEEVIDVRLLYFTRVE